MRIVVSKMVRLIAVALIGAALTVALAGHSAAAKDGRTIRIGWTAWSDAEAVTRVVKQVLEKRMHRSVHLVLLDIALQYSALARGDLDLMLMAWLPNTHADYYARVKSDVVDLGVLYTGGRLGWVVPAYVPRSSLAAIPDLKKPEVRKRLRGRIQGIDPGSGLMRLSQQTIKAYGLQNYNLISSSGAGMTAALKRALRRKKWIVVTGWRPHWMFGTFDLRFLKDPKGTLGGEESIHALARKGFAEDDPQVAAFISRIHLSLEDLEALMYASERTSYEKAAADYIATHKKQIDYWVTGKR
jgi:glycine betaine/proline transport system substrate-binding protein